MGHISESTLFILLLISCNMATNAAQVSTRISPSLNEPVVLRKSKKCPWPGTALLKQASVPGAPDRTRLIEQISPKAIEEWLNCTGPIGEEEAKRKLRRLKGWFKKSPGAKELMRRSDCPGTDLMAFFDVQATIDEAEHAADCLQSAVQTSAPDFRISTRVDEDCERMKQDRIDEAESELIATSAAAVAAGLCCGFPLTRRLWCPVFRRTLTAEVKALANFGRALLIRCPDCSDEPIARVLAMHSEEEFGKRYLTTLGSGVSRVQYQA